MSCFSDFIVVKFQIETMETSDTNTHVLDTTISASTSSSTSMSTAIGMKRPREEANDAHAACPFSSLVSIVKQHAKKLCAATGCEKKNQQVMSAANAACSAVAKLKNQGRGEESSEKKLEKTAEVNCEEVFSNGERIACMPLVDNKGGKNECFPLVESNLCTEPPTSPRPEKGASSEVLKGAKYTDVMGELTCPICQEMLLHTRTLMCGHSFCEPCIDHWLNKCLTCPVCRKDIESIPIPSRTVDKTIELLIKSDKSAQDELKSREKKYNECLAQDHEKKMKLYCLMKKAEAKGQRLMHISKPWSDTEQNRFLRGLRLYRGSPREAYCRLACLTECFVQRASLPDLMIAASNVKLGAQPQSANNGAATWDRLDTNKLRSRLIMFIHYG